MIISLYKGVFKSALRHFFALPALLIACALTAHANAQSTQVLRSTPSLQSTQPLHSIQASEQALSLHQAIARTLAQNPQLHQFLVKKKSLLGQRATSDLAPALRVGIDVENVAGSGNRANIEAMETTLALSSVIELGAKRQARVLVADARLDALKYRKQAFTLDVLGELATLFVKTLELQALSALATEARDLAKNTLRIVKSRSHKGAAPELEVKRATAALAQAQLQLDALLQQHNRNRIKLAAYWGETSPQWQQLSGTLYALAPQPHFSALYQQALASPAIQVLASEARLKTAQLQLARTQSTANLSWQVGVQRFEESRDMAFTAGVSMPLLSGKRNQGARASAMAERDALTYKKQAARLRLHAQLFEAYSQRAQYIQAIKVYQNIVLPQLSQALSATQRAYQTGRYSYQDWIAAQQALLRAKHTLIESAASAALNQTLIEQLTGKPLSAQPLTNTPATHQPLRP